MCSFVISVLGLLKRLAMRLVTPGRRHQVEAHHWEAVSTRQMSWDSIECLGRMAVHV